MAAGQRFLWRASAQTFYGFIANCDVYRDIGPYCSDRAQSGDRSEVAEWNASYKDPRITAAYAIEPGIVWGLQPEDLTDAIDDITMIGLGNGDDRMRQTNFDASGLSAMLPNATTETIAPANHFTGMPVCKFIGPLFLAVTLDDPVCTNPKGSDRAKIHEKIIDQIALKSGLKPKS